MKDVILVLVSVAVGYFAYWLIDTIDGWTYKPRHAATDSELSDKERRDVERIEGMLSDTKPDEFPIEPTVTVYPTKPTTFTGPSVRDWREWVTWHIGERFSAWRLDIGRVQGHIDRLVPTSPKIVVHQPAGRPTGSEGTRGRAQERLQVRGA